MGRRSRISSVKGLVKHPNSRTFWFRRVIPEDLRGPKHFGKREEKFTLNTSDLRKAEVDAAFHWTEITRKIDDYRNGRNPEGPTPTERDLGRLAKDWRDKWFPADEIDDKHEDQRRMSDKNDGNRSEKIEPVSAEEKLARRIERKNEFENLIYTGDTDRLKNTARDILRYSDEKFSTSEALVERFATIIAEAEKDAYQIQVNRLTGAPALEILQRDPMDYVVNNLTLSELLEKYISSKRPRVQTEAEWRTVFKRLIEVIGDKPIRQITKGQVSDFVDRIAQLPSRTSKAIKQLPVDEMIFHANQKNLQRISTETIRKHVTAIRSVFSWAMDREYVDANPASRLAPKREPSGPKRLPFSQDDLLTIFEPAMYAEYPRHDADYWIPIVCLYTGARIEEIAQLHKADVRYEENIPIIEISPNQNSGGDDGSKRVKNQASARVIPIHDDLIGIGFMGFVESRREQETKRLFSELKRNKNNRLSRSVSQSFARHLDYVGITDPRKVFHSFRHTFKDACRNASILEEIHDRLTGHTNSSVGKGYGQGHDLQVLHGELNKVLFPNIRKSQFD